MEKATDRLVGTVGLWNSPAWPEPELGYWFLPDGQGKGFAFEAATALKHAALETLQFRSLVSYIAKENLPSIKLAEKLGARLDGTVSLLTFGPHDVYRHK